MTPSEHRAFVAGLKAAQLIAARERRVQEKQSDATQDFGWSQFYDHKATGIGHVEAAIKARIQRESRKLKLKAKTKGKKR